MIKKLSYSQDYLLVIPRTMSWHATIEFILLASCTIIATDFIKLMLCLTNILLLEEHAVHFLCLIIVKLHFYKCCHH